MYLVGTLYSWAKIFTCRNSLSHNNNKLQPHYYLFYSVSICIFVHGRWYCSVSLVSAQNGVCMLYKLYPMRNRYKLRRTKNTSVILLNCYTPNASMLCVSSADGGWSDWTYYSGCSVTCGSGHKTEQRYCNNPETSSDGRYCVGPNRRTIECSRPSCPSESVYACRLCTSPSFASTVVYWMLSLFDSISWSISSLIKCSSSL